MAFSFIDLPKYQTSPLLDLSPINNALGFAAQQNQMAQKNAREDQQLSMQQERLGMEKKQFGEDMRDRQIKRLGGQIQALQELNQKNPQAAREAWTKLASSNPMLSKTLADSGIDPADHVSAINAFASELKGYQDEQRKRLIESQIGENRSKSSLQYAQAKAVGEKDPIDKWIASRLPGASASAAPAAPLPGGFQRQSSTDSPLANLAQNVADVQPQQSEPSQDPNLIRVQAANGQAQPQADIVQTPMGQMRKSDRDALAFALQMKGKKDAASALMGDKDLALTTGAKTEVDKGIVSGVEHVARLKEMAGQIKDEYLKIPFRAGQKFNALGEMFGAKLRPEDQKQLAEYTGFRANSARNFNSLLKELSGAAVTESEYKRLQLQEPNAGSGGWFDMPDSPTEFKAKMLQGIQSVQLGLARKTFLRNRENMTPEAIQNAIKSGEIERSMPLDRMKSIIDQRLDGAAREIKAQNPNIDDGALRMYLKNVQKQEFGI